MHLLVVQVQVIRHEMRLLVGIGDGPHHTLGRQNPASAHHGGNAVLVQYGNQCLTGSQLHQNLLGVKGGVLAEGLGRGLYRLLLGRRVGPEGMLNLIAQLCQNIVRDVSGVLGDEVDAHALGADELDNLLYLLQQMLGNPLEQQMRFVKEEDHPGLLGITDLRQRLKQLREHPQQEGGVQGGIIHQAPAVQNIDGTLSAVGGKPVGNPQGGLTEELLAAPALQRYDAPEDGIDAGLGNVAVLGRISGIVLCHILKHRLEILGVNEQQLLVIGDLEDHRQDVGLGGVQAQQLGQKQRAHFGDGGAKGNAHAGIDIPEHAGILLEAEAALLQPEALDTLTHIRSIQARTAHAGQVPLDIRQEHRDPGVTEGFRQHLQGNGFAGAGSAGNQAVAIGHLRQNADLLAVIIADPDFLIVIHRYPPSKFFFRKNALSP